MDPGDLSGCQNSEVIAEITDDLKGKKRPFSSKLLKQQQSDDTFQSACYVILELGKYCVVERLRLLAFSWFLFFFLQNQM